MIIDVDQCDDPDLCGSGNCMEMRNGFFCVCHTGYTGLFCDTGTIADNYICIILIIVLV